DQRVPRPCERHVKQPFHFLCVRFLKGILRCCRNIALTEGDNRLLLLRINDEPGKVFIACVYQAREKRYDYGVPLESLCFLAGYQLNSTSASGGHLER